MESYDTAQKVQKSGHETSSKKHEAARVAKMIERGDPGRMMGKLAEAA
jgi:hypothetical protein